jgi:hypothetical protein
MPKLSNATTVKKEVPFADTDELRITTQTNQQNKIQSFTALKKKKNIEKVFKVVKMDILKAWQQLEEFCKDIK